MANTHLRNPPIALALSMGTPGLGELYAGHPGRGLVTFAIGHAFLLTFLLAFVPSTGVIGLALPPFAALGYWAWSLRRSWKAADLADPDYQPRAYNSPWLYAAVLVVTLFVWRPIAIDFIRANVLQAFRNPSRSMEPSLLVGDYFYVDKRPSTRRDVRRGDIIAFASVTESGVTIVKRVVGVFGDTLAMRHGMLFRNGARQIEEYIQRIDSASDPADSEMRGWQQAYLVAGIARSAYRPSRDNWGPLVVPPRSFFVLGDNRDNSYDSRYWGFVPDDAVRGKPLVIYFSLADGGLSRIGRRFNAR